MDQMKGCGNFSICLASTQADLLLKSVTWCLAMVNLYVKERCLY